MKLFFDLPCIQDTIRLEIFCDDIKCLGDIFFIAIDTTEYSNIKGR
jgi:hypothetical protein